MQVRVYFVFNWSWANIRCSKSMYFQLLGFMPVSQSECPAMYFGFIQVYRKYCVTSILGELYLKHKSNLSPQLSAVEQSERRGGGWVELSSIGLFSTGLHICPLFSTWGGGWVELGSTGIFSNFLHWVFFHWAFLHSFPLFSTGGGGWVELGSTGLYSTVSSIMAGHFFLSLSDPPNLVSSSDFNWAPMGPVTICRIEKICQTKGVNWACGSGLSHRYWIWDSQIPSNLLPFYPHTH